MKSGREDARLIKKTINENKVLKLVILIASVSFPLILIGNMTGIISIDYVNFIDTLWIGFYSSIILIFFVDSEPLYSFKTLLFIPNFIAVLFVITFSLMGGVEALLSTIIKMVLPFLAYESIKDFIFNILGLPETY